MNNSRIAIESGRPRIRKYQKPDKQGWIDLPKAQSLIYSHLKQFPESTHFDICQTLKYDLQTVVNSISALRRLKLISD